MNKENAIIIDGVKHVLVPDRPCPKNESICENQCSLNKGCYSVCEMFQIQMLHDIISGYHFEILKTKHKQ